MLNYVKPHNELKTLFTVYGTMQFQMILAKLTELDQSVLCQLIQLHVPPIWSDFWTR